MATETERWRRLGEQLGFLVNAPTAINLGGVQVAFAALLPQFGASNGMVVDADGDLLWQHRRELAERGYGFSIVELGEESDAESLQDMLRDWGWSASEPAPTWFSQSSSS